MKDNEKKFTLPLLESPQTVRIHFRKVGNLQYISHLDLQRTFSRVLVRAGLPLWYTKGFNPHIKMIFGMPLAVGTESECEFLDVRIERDMPLSEIKDRLNQEVTEELRVVDVYPAERSFHDIAFAEYEFHIVTKGVSDEMARRVQEVLSTSPLMVSKKTKSGEKEFDLTEFLHSFTVKAEGDTLHIVAVMAAGEGRYLAPESVITALRREAGILQGSLLDEQYRILRRKVLLGDAVTEFH